MATSEVDQIQAEAPDDLQARRVSPARSRLIVGTSVLLLAVSIALFWAPLRPEAIGLNAVFAMLVMMYLRVPLAVTMLAPSLLGLYALGSWQVVVNVMSTLPFEQTTSWSLSVLPMFILMGTLLWKSGLSSALFVAARRWLGWLPGGLAVGTNLAGTGLAAVSGSSASITYALTRIGVPEMLRAGYDKRLAIGAVIVAGLPGQLIPPSILLVLFAGVANVNVGETLLAGIGPGVFVCVMFSIMIILFAKLGKGFVPARSVEQRYTWNERVSSLAKIWPLPVLFVIIIGGMFSGVFTATEAGAAAALFSVVILFLWRRKERDGLKAFGEACVETVSTVGTLFLLLVGVAALAQLINLTGISNLLADGVESLNLGRIGFLLIMVVVYLLLGTFMETLPMIVLTLPVLMPTLESLDISLYWYGAFIVLMGEIGMISPPVGILAMIIYSIVRDPKVNGGTTITLKDVWVASLWFLPMALLVILGLILFPDIATWLPDMARG